MDRPTRNDRRRLARSRAHAPGGARRPLQAAWRLVGAALLLAALAAACAPSAGEHAALVEAASTRTEPDVPAEGWAGVPAPPAQAAPTRPRPAGAPDVVILSFSGHCGVFCPTTDTWAYLDEATKLTGGVGVLDAVRAAYLEQGLSVEVFSVSSFVTAHVSGHTGKIEPGYLQAQAYLDHVKRDWIEGVSNPTHVVLLGHSHGTVWATLLAMNNLDVTFDTLISLDGICWLWWAKHKGYIRDTFTRGVWPIPFPLDQGDPCGTLAVPGQDHRMDINDVVPANVIYGLEVRTRFRLLSFDPNVLYDDDPNLRINGSGANLWGIRAGEAHSTLGRSYNEAAAWVASMITALGLPDPTRFPTSTFVLPPAPDGFGYQRGLTTP